MQGIAASSKATRLFIAKQKAFSKDKASKAEAIMVIMCKRTPTSDCSGRTLMPVSQQPEGTGKDQDRAPQSNHTQEDSASSICTDMHGNVRTRVVFVLLSVRAVRLPCCQ